MNEPSQPVVDAQPKPAAWSALVKRSLWDGVLPEALGLCLVLVICAGFASFCWISVIHTRDQALAAQRSEATGLARGFAAALGAVADGDDAAVRGVVAGLSQAKGVRSWRWVAEGGSVRALWPASATILPEAVPNGAGAASDNSVSQRRDAGATTFQASAADTIVCAADVTSAAGKPAGTVEIELARPRGGTFSAGLLGGLAWTAAATLVAFIAVYRRLRRHLRPMDAIQRNLESYVGGLEKELITLTLSDSLGSVARVWNQMIAQMANLQQQLQIRQEADKIGDVLQRFESGVFRRLLDRMPIGVLHVGRDQCVVYANAAASGLLGAQVESLVGRSVSEAVGEEAVSQALVGASMRASGGLSVDRQRKDGDQESTLRFFVLPASDNGDGEALITIEDVGHIREADRARDNFLYHVTHELRTPLTNIQAYAETLSKPGFDDEQTRKECYNVITSETRRLSRLVEDILSISQLEVGTVRVELGDVDLARLIRQMVEDNLGAADEKRIDLTLKLAPKVPKIRGDKQRLSVLVNNLIGNAVKYTPEEGKVEVRVEVSDRYIRISVSDNGIGIDPADQPHVFDKFYRAASEAVQTVPGTGLGLAIAREVARLHGGDITLDSELGKGSMFAVELPRPTTEI